MRGGEESRLTADGVGTGSGGSEITGAFDGALLATGGAGALLATGGLAGGRMGAG